MAPYTIMALMVSIRREMAKPTQAFSTGVKDMLYINRRNIKKIYKIQIIRFYIKYLDMNMWHKYTALHNTVFVLRHLMT